MSRIKILTKKNLPKYDLEMFKKYMNRPDLLAGYAEFRREIKKDLDKGKKFRL